MQEINDLLKKGRMVATASNRKTIAVSICNEDEDTICLWNVENQKPYPAVQDKKDGFFDKNLIISDDNHLLVTWTFSGRIVIYNLKPSPESIKPLECLQKIKKTYCNSSGHFFRVKLVKIIPNTNLIAILYHNDSPTASIKNRVQIFNPRTNKDLHSFNVPNCHFMEFFATETMITTGHNCINLWDLKEKSKNPTHSIKTNDQIRQIIKLSNTQCLVHEGDFIKIYNINPLECIKTTSLKKYFNNSLYNLDNKHFISIQCSSSTGYELNLFKLNDKNDFELFKNPPYPIELDIPITNYPINFIPTQKDKATWLCIIGNNIVHTITLPVNVVVSENKYTP